MYKIYCDGSSSGKSNQAGGWAFVITDDDDIIYCDYGGNPQTTNNIMELTAAIKGMEWFVDNDLEGVVELISDSEYTLGLASGRYHPSKNIELAKRIRELAVRTGAKCIWVRGHKGNILNERCDSLAKRGKEENQQ